VKYSPLLIIVLIAGLAPSTLQGGSSLAARVKAAKAAREAAARADESATVQAAPIRQAQATTTREPAPSGRINVADWLNGTTATTRSMASNEEEEDTPVAKSAPDERVTQHSPYRSSRRQNSSAAPLADPAPTPPAESQATLPDLSRPRVELSPAGNEQGDRSEAIDNASAEVTDDIETDEIETDEIETDEIETDEIESPARRPILELVPQRQTNQTDTPSSATATAVEEPAATDRQEGSTGTVVSETSTPEQTQDDGAEVEQAVPDDEESTPQELAPAAPKKQFSPSMLRLRDSIRSCLAYYYQRPESTSERSPWGVMHALISYGVDTELVAGRQRVNAIGWLCYNRPCRGIKLFSYDGQYPVPRNGPGFQGHEGQFLSMLALSRVKSTYPMRVEGEELTVQDLIEYEKATCRPKSELTFKLIGLAHYLPSDATWTSKWGVKWSIPRLIQEELAQPINGACCGGTHRLIGYSMALRARRKRGEPLDGQWLRAHKYVDSYHKYVIKLQNRDGSFSTNWFKGRAGSGDIDRRIQTTGHILEWLVFSLPEEELTDPRIIRAVSYLNSVMIRNRQRDWEIGPRGHALRALAVYNERVFGDQPGQRRALLARRPGK
jgi:hypothetical protein